MSIKPTRQPSEIGFFLFRQIVSNANFALIDFAVFHLSSPGGDLREKVVFILFQLICHCISEEKL